MRRLRSGPARAAHAAIALVTGATVLAFAAPAARAAGPTCTYNAQPSIVTGVTGGTAVTVACTGLGAAQVISINEESPLAAIVQPATSVPFESSFLTAVTATADATGALTTTFTLPATFVAGDPAAVCPPTQAQVDAGLSTCVLAVRDAVSTAMAAPPAQLVYTGQPTPSNTPTVSVTNGVSFVAGDIVTLGGAGFWGAPSASTPTVSFGAIVASAVPMSPPTIAGTSYTCATDCNGVAGTLTPGGTLTGSVVVPAGLAAGPTTVTVAQANTTPFPGNGPLGAVQATIQVNMLAGPVAAAAPNSGGPGTPVQVTGTGWDPQGPAASLAFLTPSVPGGAVSVGAALVDANGNLVGQITVTSDDLLGANPIVVTQGPLAAQAAFTVTNITSSCVAPSCTNNQVLSQPITGGSLALSQQSFNVALSTVTLNGQTQQSTGALNPLTVVDNRGTLVGWTVTATLQGDFVNQAPIGATANNVIPASNLSWVPSVALLSAGSGDLTQVQAGGATSLSTSAGVTLCAAPVGGGGGGYSCGASLALTIPASIATGTYTTILNLTII